MRYGAGYEVPDTMFCTACCCCGFPLRSFLLNQELKDDFINFKYYQVFYITRILYEHFL